MCCHNLRLHYLQNYEIECFCRYQGVARELSLHCLLTEIFSLPSNRRDILCNVCQKPVLAGREHNPVKASLIKRPCYVPNKNKQWLRFLKFWKTWHAISTAWLQSGGVSNFWTWLTTGHCVMHGTQTQYSLSHVTQMANLGLPRGARALMCMEMVLSRFTYKSKGFLSM